MLLYKIYSSDHGKEIKIKSEKAVINTHQDLKNYTSRKSKASKTEKNHMKLNATISDLSQHKEVSSLTYERYKRKMSENSTDKKNSNNTQVSKISNKLILESKDQTISKE